MVGDVKAYIVRSDGAELTVGDGDWRIPKDGLENWANLPYTVTSYESPSTDGAIIMNKRVASVDRTITAECKSANPDESRAKAIEFFNPKFTFQVHMTYRGRTRWCEGEQIAFKASEGNIYQPPTITWTILCPNPYLQSESNFGKDIAEVVPMMGFPWVSALPTNPITKQPNTLTNRYSVTSAHTFKREVELVNTGDVESPIKIVIDANGTVYRPSISLNEGYVEFGGYIYEGQRIVLDTTQRPPAAILSGDGLPNQINALKMLDRNSTITSLKVQVGKNVIKYDAKEGNESMSVMVYWNEQYLGI